MPNMELTLLKEEQIYGENRLKIFDVIGTKAAVTDYAILCGTYASTTNYVGEEKLENRTSWYWTKTADGANDARIVTSYGFSSWNYVGNRQGCVRPVVMFSQIQNQCQNISKGNNRELIVEWKSFPQQSVSEQLEDELNRNLNQDLIKEIDYVTTDSVDPNDFQQGFVGEEQKVYEYQGKRYAKVRANTIEEEVTLSNGRTYKKGEYVWIAIPPLRWYVDLESGIAFTEKLITPAQFNQIRNYKGDFENMDIYRFMNSILLKSMNFNYQVNGINLAEQIKSVNRSLQQEIIEEEKKISFIQARIELLRNSIAINDALINVYSLDNNQEEKEYQKVK